MNIILFRHGISEDLEVGSSKSDSERQLTKKGRKQMKQVAKGLRRMVGSGCLVACSPYVRAVQTAEILLKELWKGGESEFLVVEKMKSGVEPESATEWLAQQDPEAKVILVGHEPDFSRLMAYLTAGAGAAYGRLSKAGACLIHCPSTPSAGRGELIWLVTPAMIKRLGA